MNVALLIKPLHQLKVLNTSNPDVLIKNFGQWQRMKIDGRNKVRVKPMTMKKKELIDFMKKMLIKFRSHARRVCRQYQQIKGLKGKLPDNHIIMQMDFSDAMQQVKSNLVTSTRMQ